MKWKWSELIFNLDSLNFFVLCQDREFFCWFPVAIAVESNLSWAAPSSVLIMVMLGLHWCFVSGQLFPLIPSPREIGYWCFPETWCGHISCCFFLPGTYTCCFLKMIFFHLNTGSSTQRLILSLFFTRTMGIKKKTRNRWRLSYTLFHSLCFLPGLGHMIWF